jgi:hypothetical protein
MLSVNKAYIDTIFEHILSYICCERLLCNWAFEFDKSARFIIIRFSSIFSL